MRKLAITKMLVSEDTRSLFFLITNDLTIIEIFQDV